MCVVVIFFKQKTAYEMRISDWSSDVCSSDLRVLAEFVALGRPTLPEGIDVDGLPHALLEITGGDILMVTRTGELPRCDRLSGVSQSRTRRRLQCNFSGSCISSADCPAAEALCQCRDVGKPSHLR